MKKHFLLLPLVSSILFSCKSQSDYNYPIPYNLNEAKLKLILEDELNEISGISLTEDGKQIIGVADEKGILYFIDASTGEILKRLEFHKDGDYEDVELVGNDLFVLKILFSSKKHRGVRGFSILLENTSSGPANPKALKFE